VEAVTIKQVAERSGVAISSVSRVLNNHPDVSEAMRQRVMSATQELGYQPDYLAQSLRRGATRSVGFLLRDLSNPIFADIVKGAELRLREDGYSLLLTNSEGDPTLGEEHLRALRLRRVDGFLLSLQSEMETNALNELSAQKLPIVLVDREVPSLTASIVRCDHRTGVRNATQHLRELGHDRIAFISGPHDILATRDRLKGFREAFVGEGLACDEELIRLGSYSRQFGYEETLQLLSRPSRPTAILSGGVQSTTGVLAALHQRGLFVGTDMSLVSCDEVELLRYLSPQISVVRRDGALIGRLAAELLLELLLEEAPVRTAIVPTEYVARGSSAAPAR
jgi:LacI family transcriptional regulator